MKITPFLFEGEITVRVISRDKALLFVTADVCKAAGIANASQATQNLDDDEKGICSIDTPGGAQSVLVVTQGGLFTLILRCKDAMTKGTVAHRFRRWVTSEVLPSLYRDGQYAPKGPPELPSLPEALRVRMVSEIRKTFGTRAAAQAWFKLDLPVVAAMHLPGAQSDLFAP